jgi:phosphoenolpyruvate carboxykinase (ATP)
MALSKPACQARRRRLGKGGAFLVSTGQFTGRSPKDKFVVRTAFGRKHDLVGKQRRRCRPKGLTRLHADMLAHMKGRDYFVQDLYAGADPVHRLDVRVVTELAWHGLFIRHLLRRPAGGAGQLSPEWTIINCPSFKADPARHGCRSETVIALNFDKKLILIANTPMRARTRNRSSPC